MTKHYLLLLVLLLLSIKLIADGVQPIGAGTVNDPYQISSLDNLLWISTTPDSWSSHFVQTADIDASASINMNNGNGFPPIGDAQHDGCYGSSLNSIYFTGKFDGQGYCIDSLYISETYANNSDYTGLFSGIDCAEVRNVHVTNASFIGGIEGGIAGYAQDSEILNCSFSGDSQVFGGIVAFANRSSINNCINRGNFIYGGIVGICSSSRIYNCVNEGNHSGMNHSETVGGIAGLSRAVSIIHNCTNNSNSIGGFIAGGIVGDNSASIVSNSTNNGMVNSRIPGGVVGFNENFSTITNCTNNADLVHGGGIAYINSNSSISLCTNTGNIVNTDTQHSENGGIVCELASASRILMCTNTGDITGGGIFGKIHSWPVYLINNYYDSTVVEINGDSQNRIGALDSETYREWIENDRRIDIENYFERSGDEYVIATIDDFRLLNAFSQSDHRFILANSINLSNEPDFFIPYFSGEFNGNGNSILHPDLQEANAKYIGLFGFLNNADIHNLGIVDSNVVGQENVGGLAGLSYNSQIRNCYVTGSVSGSGSVGGLIGGSNSSDIEYCYSTCMVNGDSQVGGLVGFNNERSVLSSFWNIDTSGYTESGGGIGLTSNEMRTLSTYLNSGWDFINEITNGTNDYWEMNFMQNNGYPYLIPQVVTSTEDDQSAPEQPFLSALIGNYPNPFNPETTVIFTIAKSGNVDLSIYNLKGQRVRTLANRQFLTGEHSLIWNGTDDSGTSVGSGIYFYKLSINNLTVSTKKCILMK